MARSSKKVKTAAPSKVGGQAFMGPIEEAVPIDPESLVDGEEDLLAEMLAGTDFESSTQNPTTVRPVVDRLPPNFRLVLCTVGPHQNVRVMVRPNNKNYLPRMEIPLDIDLGNFNPNDLLIYNGDPPRRRGIW